MRFRQVGVVEDTCNQNAHEAVGKGFICLIPTILHRETLSQKKKHEIQNTKIKIKKERDEEKEYVLMS